ncbi:hypothetical protein, partial [uncultured Selenomonas sp.]|uniref:hypothetical protein n=1 Tax=uncultured Selenomonas sp. TaxID=159275 RepID=UPI0025D68CDA
AKAVCLAASTIAERASDFFFHAGLPTVMGEASKFAAILPPKFQNTVIFSKMTIKYKNSCEALYHAVSRDTKSDF